MGCGGSKEPPNWPQGIPIKQAPFKTWDEQVEVGAVWTATPNDVAQCVAICNWAAAEGWTVRASGHKTAFAPLTFTSKTPDAPKCICVETTNIAKITEVDGDKMTATVQAGCKLIDLLKGLDEKGLTLVQYPGYGDLTIGGCIATGSHGWAGPAVITAPGTVPGSVANSVLEISCIVSDANGKYEVKTFKREDAEGRAMIVTFGRAFIVDIKLRVAPQYNLRTMSIFDYDYAITFAPPGEDGKPPQGSFQATYDKVGRVSVIWVPYTDTVWTRWMEYAPTMPDGSREVTEPYAYTFQNLGAEPWQTSALEAMLGNPHKTASQRIAEAIERPFTKGSTGPLTWVVDGWANCVHEVQEAVGVNKALHLVTLPYMKMTAMAMRMGNVHYNTGSLWGKSYNLGLYVTDGLRISSNGLSIICNRKHMQKAIHASMTIFRTTLDEFQAQGKYPLNMPLEYRAGGIDEPEYANTVGSPSLSFLHFGEKCKANDWNVAIHIDNVYLSKTPHFTEYAMIVNERHEQHPDLSGNNAMMMCEWSKGFAADKEAMWVNEAALKKQRERLPEWNTAIDILNKNDSKRLFTNPFLDTFAVKI